MARELDDVNERRLRCGWQPQVLGLLAFLLLGCVAGRPARSTAVPDLVGTYSLVMVDEKVLPCTVAHAGSPLVKSGVFTIHADGTCSSRIVFVTPGGGEMVREVKASYTRAGNELTMKWENAGMTIGNAEGDSFTMDNEGILFVYRR